MTDSIPNPETTADEELRARVKHWLDNGGAEQLEAAFAKADEASRQFREATRVDWRTMMEPMAI